MTVVVIGVDGGGTHTRALVADENGREVGSAEGPGSAVRPGQSARSAEIIATVVREALAATDLDGDVIPRVLSVGVAGVGRESEREALWQALTDLGLAEEVVIRTDAIIALEDAFADGSGVLLIAGTGSMAVGRSPTGDVSRCGGWGPVIGDEGGGAWIGRRALSVVTAASDGREPDTALVGAILTVTEQADVTGLVQWASAASPAMLATLAPAVLACAENGDLRANALLSMAVEELALHIRALARVLFVDERAAVTVALSGGLLVRGSLLRKRLEHRLKSMVPGASVRPDVVIPQRGAVRNAIRHLETVAR